MRVLVTGGAGFIGSHIADAYLAAGHTVGVVDNLSTGSAENLDPRIRLWQTDIRDTAIDSILAEFRPDIVSHHAAQIRYRSRHATRGATPRSIFWAH